MFDIEMSRTYLMKHLKIMNIHTEPLIVGTVDRMDSYARECPIDYDYKDFQS